MATKTLMSWSSGKDSAWALLQLQRDPEIELLGLFTTRNGENDRVAMHGVRAELLEAQALSLGLELTAVSLPSPCTNETYEARVNEALLMEKARGVQVMAFGDLYLEDVRAYRERQVESVGLPARFPLWGRNTHELALEMIEGGLEAVLTCVDSEALPAEFAGRAFDRELLRDLPPGVDPCGEGGEFHTFVHAGPMLENPIAIRAGEVVERQRFVFADFLLDSRTP